MSSVNNNEVFFLHSNNSFQYFVPYEEIPDILFSVLYIRLYQQPLCRQSKHLLSFRTEYRLTVGNVFPMDMKVQVVLWHTSNLCSLREDCTNIHGGVELP